MNWRKALLTVVLATGLVASIVQGAYACDDDRYYDSYDRYDRYDRYGSYDRSYDRGYDRRSSYDPYYGRSGYGYSDPFDYDGDGKFKFKRDWPSLVGLFLNTQVGQ